MVIFHNYPFTIISHKLFQDFFGSLKPKFQIYSCTTLKINVMVMYELMKNNILQEIETLDQIYLTTDL